MSEKRFTHKKWYNERQLFDGDEPFAIVDVYNQAVTICNKLNELAEENQHIKNTIQEAYNNERTHIGQSVLKQLIQNIGDINE